ncbi:MAG: GNAT family N-acetyltransferase [Actinobacteria bacterium]|nr:GNAT family N-acetyltransferase [Actinomycetota bacterium]
MSADPVIRTIRSADISGVVALWEEAGMAAYELSGDAADEITSKMDRDPDLFIVAEADGGVVAVVMGTWDGHRGRIKRLAVRSDLRRSGLGRRMVEELERRFVDAGIRRIRLEVWSHNEGGLAFWEDLGYRLQPEIRYFVHNLDDSDDPC